MAITEKDIMISNKSYTKKDFASLYPEGVKFVQGITNRYDPQASNESDPGVVLLKDVAFFTDKNNYNVDKNILEAFMPSCTQETSMRMNCESRGHDMRYYVASEVELTLTYVGTAFEDSDVDSITLKAYKTIVTSDDSSIFYILTKDVEFKKEGQVEKAWAIEGQLETLTVAGSSDETLIQLDNLDDNNRIYFPVSQVAENGVIIKSSSGQEWTLTKNLNSEQPGKRFYKFGYDSRKELPYVEFPSDIASLIENGLKIDYIITTGNNGNVKANYLTKLYSAKAVKNNSEDYSVITDENTSDISVYNASASITGKDPETIDEAYNAYNKTIGTFNTPVTCRDYANFVYNLKDNENVYNVVSNIQVADRRDDINYSVRVSSLDEFGPRFINYDYTAHNNGIKAFELCLYPLKPISAYTLTSYIDSFKPLSVSKYIEEELEGSQSISHDFKNLDASDIYAIKNYAKLNAKIVTTYKVNNYERATIIANVQKALMTKFSSRNVDYGYEIPYDSILDVIQTADTRISSVSLAEPELVTYYLRKDGEEVAQASYDSTSTKDGVNYFTTVLAKNIIAGKISLFDYDNDFNYDFEQEQVTSTISGSETPQEMKLTNLKEIQTGTSIALTANTQSSALDENEVIQVVGPNIVTDIPYGAYIYYRYNGIDVSDKTNRQLSSGEYLEVYYTDAEGSIQVKRYEDTIIQPVGFNLITTTQSAGEGRVERPVGSGNWYDSIGAKASINIRKVNKTTLGKTYNCFWIRNNADNKLFTASDYTGTIGEIILGDNEYFFYTDAGFNTLVTLGSGTTLKTNLPSNFNWKCASINYADIAEKGLDALKEKCVQINFTKDSDSVNGTYIDAVENTILTLVEGDDIKIAETKTLSNSLVAISGAIEYHSGGEFGSLPAFSGIAGVSWRIKSRFDINASKEKSQIIKNTRQHVKFIDKDSHSVYLHKVGQKFNLNISTQLAGSDSIDVRQLDYLNSTDDHQEYLYPLSVYDFKDSTSKVINRNDKLFVLQDITSTTNVTIAIPTLTDETSVLALYWNPNDNGGTISITSDEYDSEEETDTISLFNDTHAGTQLTAISTKGLYVITIPNSVTSLTIKGVSGKGNLTIDYPKYYKGDLSSDTGYNKALGIDTLVDEINSAGGTVTAGDILEKLMSKLKNYGSDLFYYSADIDNSKIIETNDMASPYSLYDYNNIANKFVITELVVNTALDNIDSTHKLNSDIDVVRSSRI